MAGYKGMPVDQCTATAFATGERCRRLSTRGTTTCAKHGAQIPAVKRAALVRTTLYDAMTLGDRRPAWEILSDTMHAADVMFRDARVTLQTSDEVTPQQLTRFIDALERNARLAQVVLSSRAQEQMNRSHRLDGEEMARIYIAAIADADVDEATAARLRGALSRQMRAMDSQSRDTIQAEVVDADG